MTFPGLVAANNLSDVVDRERAWTNIGSGIASNDLPETYYDNVSLLLHGDGINGSTTIIDSSPSPKTVTAFGNAQISTAQSKFGGSSIAFDGTGDYLTLTTSSDFNFGTGDFTAEGFFYITSTATDKFILASTAVGGFFFGFRIGGTTNGWGVGRNGIAWDAESGTLPVLNTWQHVAWARQGSTLRIYVDGTQVYLSSNAFDYGLNGGTVRVGYLDSLRQLSGYIDEFRITKGIARYTSNFTPPTAPFPPVLSITTTATIKGADILALEGVRNTSTRDFIFTKGLTSAAQPRITSASVATASGATLRDNALLKASPSSIGDYFFPRGFLDAPNLQINGLSVASISSSPFSGDTATVPLSLSFFGAPTNWRFSQPMVSGTITSPDKAIPIETDTFIFYAKAGQS